MLPSFYKRALGVAYQIPSEETLRQRLDDIGSSIRPKILAENVEMLRSNGIHPSKIKEGKDSWIKLAKEHCQNVTTPRDGKTVYVGSDWRDVAYTCEDGTAKTQTIRIVYKIIERTTDKNGQFLLVPDIEVNTFWTNLDWKDEDVIANYHAHGEFSQFAHPCCRQRKTARISPGRSLLQIATYLLSTVQIIFHLIQPLLKFLYRKRFVKVKPLCEFTVIFP